MHEADCSVVCVAYAWTGTQGQAQAGLARAEVKNAVAHEEKQAVEEEGYLLGMDEHGVLAQPHYHDPYYA